MSHLLTNYLCLMLSQQTKEMHMMHIKQRTCAHKAGMCYHSPNPWHCIYQAQPHRQPAMLACPQHVMSAAEAQLNVQNLNLGSCKPSHKQYSLHSALIKPAYPRQKAPTPFPQTALLSDDGNPVSPGRVVASTAGSLKIIGEIRDWATVSITTCEVFHNTVMQVHTCSL